MPNIDEVMLFLIFACLITKWYLNEKSYGRKRAILITEAIKNGRQEFVVKEKSIIQRFEKTSKFSFTYSDICITSAVTNDKLYIFQLKNKKYFKEFQENQNFIGYIHPNGRCLITKVGNHHNPTKNYRIVEITNSFDYKQEASKSSLHVATAAQQFK